MTNKELIGKLQNDRELPIMVVVNEDVIAGDQFTWWVAKIDKIKAEKVYYTDNRSPYGEASYLFYDEGEKAEWWLYDELCDIIDDEEADSLSYEELLKVYEELPWKDVIVIYVDGDVDFE